MSDYEEAVKAVMEREKEVLGQDAITRARNTPGIEVSETEDITLTGDGKEAIKRLINTYEDVAGNLAGWLIARELKQKGFEDLDLPEEIEDKMD